jgi:hypothetical protein
MAEVVGVEGSRSIQPRVNRDRAFYTGIAVALALTVFAGFSRTYYLPLAGGATPTTFSGGVVSPLVHLHGVLFTGWVLLFVAQTSLIASRRVWMHRRMGIAGAVLAAAMIGAGTATAITAAGAGVAPPGVEPLVFLAIPLTDMVLFGTFVAAAVWHRRNREAHKRLMLLAYLSILAAAMARLPGVMPLGPPGFFGLTFLFLAAAIAYDLFSRRRVHPVYIWGGLLLVLSVPARLLMSQTAAWGSFAAMLTR